MKGMIESGAPIIDRGEGCYLWDINGKRYFDGLSGLFTVQIGYGREEMAEAAALQMRRLSYASHFGYSNGPSIELAARVAELAPGSLNRVFFTASGSEAVETALKMARQYHKLHGYSGRYKTISRKLAYHGTSFGALSINGITPVRTPFEPLVPGARHVNNTNCYRCPSRGAEGGCCMRCLKEIEDTILFEGPDTVSAIVVEPVQNCGGTFTPPPGYMQGIRTLCDQYGILFISDEVICAYGRLGTMFGHQKYDYQPDIVTMAKGLSSGYQPIGGCLVADDVADTFMDTSSGLFMHGITFGGHPVAAAVALKNLEIMTTERVVENVAANEAYFRGLLVDLMDQHDCVGDVRGAGYFMSLELVKNKETKEMFTDQESEDLLRNFASSRLLEEGLICRADDRGEPVIQLSPPLISTREQLDMIADTLDRVFTDIDWRLRQRTPLRAVPSGWSAPATGAQA
jgi:adenosylmethionine-8-amino-7-oxononanoate aminotransferase